MISAFRLFGIGIILGIANVIPGVSGGTMAVVFGVYDRLIAVITPQIKKILAAWKFWLPLGVGLVAGILLFARFFTWAFEHYPAPVRCFFTGIILGSLPLIFFKARSVSNRNNRGGG